MLLLAHPILSTPQMKYNPNIVAAYFREIGLPRPVFEYCFHPTRKWRLDIAWPEERVVLEVQGGIFIQGRHSRGAALLKEWEKLNTLAGMGWRVLYCQPKDVCTGAMVEVIAQTLSWNIEKDRQDAARIQRGGVEILRTDQV